MTAKSGDAGFDSRAFRRALGNFATGVTIVTAKSPAGLTAGVTASSFNSVSLTPPLILWSCLKDSASCAVFESATHFAVNILASDQMDMSNQFASRQDDKFAGIEWEEGVAGAPLLSNCAGRLQCETYNKIDGGDHWIFIGKVIAFDDLGRPPLCFHQGSYSVLMSHPGSAAKESEQASAGPGASRLGNHTFYLMLMAVRAYQARYQPKMEALGLSVIESRSLLVLGDHPGLDAGQLSARTNSPVVEISEALAMLTDSGMLAESANGYTLTESGRAKADQCWKLADEHAVEAFANLDADQMEGFKDVLRGVIGQ